MSEKITPTYTAPIPDELVVRLAHYAGQLEESDHINSMEWDQLCSAIQSVITAYYNNPAENHAVSSIEDVAYMYFIQQFGMEEFREDAQRHGWLNYSLDEMVIKAKSLSDLPYTQSVEQMLSGVQSRQKGREEEFKSFFYTFGTSAQFPFQKGYVEIQAPDRTSADKMFSEYFPSVHPGILNCSSVYNKSDFQTYKEKAIKSGAEDWLTCHGVISEGHFKPGEKAHKDHPEPSLSGR